MLNVMKLIIKTVNYGKKTVTTDPFCFLVFRLHPVKFFSDEAVIPGDGIKLTDDPASALYNEQLKPAVRLLRPCQVTAHTRHVTHRSISYKASYFNLHYHTLKTI